MKKNQSKNKFKLVKWKNKLVPTLFGSVISLTPLMTAATDTKKQSTTTSPSGNSAASQGAQQSSLSTISDEDYNKMSKIVAYNDDNKLPNDDIEKIDGQNLYVVKKEKRDSVTDQVKLLRNIDKPNSIRQTKYYKIKISEVKKDKLTFAKNIKFDLASIKTILRNSTSEKFSQPKEIVVQISQNDLSDNNEIATFQFKVFGKHGGEIREKKYNAKLIWKENSNSKFDLWLQYPPIKRHGGEDENIIKYEIVDSNKVEYVSQEIKKVFYSWSLKPNRSIYNKDLWKSATDHIKKGKTDNDKKDLLYDFLKNEINLDLIKFKSEILGFKLIGRKNGIFFPYKLFGKKNSFFYNKFDLEYYLSQAFEKYGNINFAFVSTKLKSDFSSLQLNAVLSSKDLGIEELVITNNKRFTYSYKIKENNDGVLKLEVTLKSRGDSKTREFFVIAKDKNEEEEVKKQQAVDGEKTRIEALTIFTINKSATVPANSLSKEELQLGSLIQGAEYKITHDKVSSNQATFNISIKITKDGKEATATREVAFTGISEAAAKQQAVDGEKTRIEALAKLTITKTATVPADSLNEADLQLGSRLQGAKYAITHDKVSSNQATFNISIKITKDGKEATATREVAFTGINEAKDAAKQQAVEDEKTRIEALAKLTITKTATVPADSLNEAELQLGSGLQGAKYAITHDEVSSNQATFNISIKITKDGKEATATRKVAFNGIDEAKKARTLIAAIKKIAGEEDNTQLQVVTGKKTVSIETAVAEINNKAKFNEYTGKDLSGIPNINLTNFNSKKVGQNIEVTITIPGLNSGNTIKYLIAGLKTQAKLNEVAANADITTVETLFDDLKNAGTSGTSTNLPEKATTLPSTLKDETNPNKIGFNNPLEKPKANPKRVIAAFSVKDVDDAKGTLVVEATLSKTPGDVQTVEFTLTGYQTTAEANKVAADADITAAKALFDGLKNAKSGTKTKLDSSSTTLPSKLKDDGAASATTIGFDNPLEKDGVDPKGVTATFSIKSADDAKGTLVVETTLSKDQGNDQKVEFTLIGYQTTAEANKVAADADITAAKALFDGLKNADPGTETNLPAKATTLPSKLETDGAASATTIGFDNPLEKDGVDAKGVTATFSIKSVDDVNGKLVVKAILSKASGDAQTVEFTLTGYQTTAEANKVAADADITAAKALFDGLKNAESGTKTKLDSSSTTLPSKLETDGAASATTIGFDNPLEKDGVDAKGVTATFSIKSVDDVNGKLVVKAILSKASGDAQTVEFTLTGYQTTAEANKVAADADITAAKALFDGLKNADPGTKTKLDSSSTTLPSKLETDGAASATTIGFDNPLEKDGVDAKGVTATFSIKSVDDVNGKLVVKAILSKASGDAQTVEFTLTGYQTTAEANKVAADAAIMEAKALFSKLISAFDGIPTNLLKGATTLPSTLKDETNPNKIGFNNPLEKPKANPKRVIAAFSVKDVDDANGKLVVKAILSKASGDAQTVEFTLIGYQTTAVANKVAADAAIMEAKALFSKLISAFDGIPTNLLKGATTLPSTLKDETNPNKIGFNNPLEKPKANPKRVIAAFSVKDVDDANGKLKVEVTLSKAPGKSETFRFTLIGYQTTSKANEVKEATEAIKAAKTLFSKLTSDETPTNLLKGATTLPSTLKDETNPNKIGFNNPLEKPKANPKRVIAAFSVKDVDDANGKLKVEVTLSKAPGKSETFRFTLIGYQTTPKAKDAAKQKVVDDEKTRIEALAKLTITKTATVPADSLNEAELQLGSGLQGAKYAITHDEVSTNQATFNVSVKIIKDGKEATATRAVAFTGIDEAKSKEIKAINQDIIKNEQTRIEALEKLTINKSEVVPADSLNEAELQLGSGLQGATYEITHDEVSTNQATFNVSVKIIKDGKEATATRAVAFTGIDEAKDAAKQQAVEDEKTRIEALEKLTINKSEVVPADSLNEAELQLGSGLQGATYEITHDEVSTNQATFNVSVKIIKDGKEATATREVAFTGISEAAAKQQAVDGEKTRIEKLPKITITREFDILANSLKEKDLQLGSGLQGAKYAITHDKVSSNQATFNISIKITKDGKEATATRAVAFTGISEAAAKQQAVDGEKTRIEALAKLTITKTATVPADSLNEAELQLGSRLQGAKYAITHDKVSSNQAIFNISIKITKDGKEATATRAVAFTGISEAAAKQQAVDGEKTRIEALAKLTITKTATVPADSLNEAELQLGSRLQGAKYAITHDKVSSNQATFNISIKITKDGKEATATRAVAFTGINEAKSKEIKAINQDIIKNEQTRIEALEKLTINKSEVVPADSLNEAELQLGSGLQGATYEITHDKVSSNQATFNISIKITKDGKEATATRAVAFTGINEAKDAAKQKVVDGEKTRIEALAKLTITKTATVPADSLNEAELQLGSRLQGAEYKITHDKVSSNQATFNISIKITKDGKEATATRAVAFTGISEAAAKQQAVDGEKTRIEALAKLTITKTATVPANSLSKEELGLELDSGLQGAEYKITHDKVSSNQATFNVSVKIIKDGKEATATREVAFTGINEAKSKEIKAINQDIIKNEQTRIEALEKLTINKSEVVPADSLNEAELQLGSGLQGATYEITHDEVSTNQATFNVSVKIIKDGKEATATRAVAFTGINEAKDAAKQQAVEDEKTRIEALAKLTITKTATVPTNGLTQDELQLGSGLQGAEYKITHDEVSSNQATFYVSVKITKDGKEATARREVAFTGIDEAKDAAKQQAVDDEQTRINALERLEINKLLSNIAKNSLTKLELKLGKTNPDLKYKVIHETITSDGNFDITIKITKDGKEAEATRKVSIIGIDETKQEVSSSKTSGLSKGVIIGIAIGVSVFTLGLAFIVFKLLKSKKLND